MNINMFNVTKMLMLRPYIPKSKNTYIYIVDISPIFIFI